MTHAGILYSSEKHAAGTGRRILLTGLGVVFAVGVACWAILWRNSSILYTTISHGDRARKRVALTFDDGPHPEYTARTLDILAAHGAKATFFCLGALVDRYPGIVRRMHHEGHLVANHGFDHSLRDFFRPPDSAHRSIMKSGSIIQGITGYFPRFYRPPVGIKTPPRVLSAYRLGLAWAGWSRQATDGGSLALSLHKATSLVAAMQSGDILLLHDGRISTTGTMLSSSASCLDKYAQALEALIGGLRDKGFELVRLDLLTGLPPGLDSASAMAGESSSWRLIKAHLGALGQEKASP
ncbi:MAG: polysaccharide deacetylase family protein, partial [Kiritimatiellia bacterium]